MIALASCIALLIGWYRGFTLKSLELTAAAFVVVLAVQTIGLVVTGRDTAQHYWVTVVLIACGWVAALFVGSFARRRLRP